MINHTGRYVGVGKVELTVVCHDCKKDQVFEVPASEYEAVLKPNRRNIQVAMPSVPPAQRELLISGTCGKCWDKMFPAEEEDMRL